MKKAIGVVIGFVLFMTSPGIVFAQAPSETKEARKHEEMMGGKETQERMKVPPMMQQHGMMMKMMMPKSIVASGDGSVIVMVGNKLLKYDKDLNLVKEAQIKVDVESMEKMMEEMREKDFMGHSMMQGCEECSKPVQKEKGTPMSGPSPEEGE